MLLILLAYRIFHFPELFLDFGNKLIQSTRVVSTQNSEARWGASGTNVFDRMLQAQYPRLYVTSYR